MRVTAIWNGRKNVAVCLVVSGLDLLEIQRQRLHAIKIALQNKNDQRGSLYEQERDCCFII